MVGATLKVDITRLERARNLRGGYLLAFKSKDGEAFDAFVARIKQMPMTHRAWMPEQRAWWISEDVMRVLVWEYPELKPKVDAAPMEPEKPKTEQEKQQEREKQQARDDARRRREDAERRFREEADRFQRQYQSYTQSASGSVPASVRDAFTVLYLLPSAPKEVVDAVYRALSKKAHPEAGGSTDAMKRLNIAHDLIYKHHGWVTRVIVG